MSSIPKSSASIFKKIQTSKHIVTVDSIIYNMAVDPMERKLYWINSHGKIRRLNLKGDHIKNLVRDINIKGPSDIAVDAEGGKLYWTEGLRILRANLDGGNIQNVLIASSDTGTVLGLINIAIAHRKIYWNQIEIDPTKYPNTPNNFGGRILRAKRNGSNIEELVADGSMGFNFTVDVDGQALYYTNFPSDPYRHNFSGRYPGFRKQDCSLL